MYISLDIWLCKSNDFTTDVCVGIGLSKKLDKLSQNKDCKVLKTWLHKKSHILECDFLCVWPRKAG